MSKIKEQSINYALISYMGILIGAASTLLIQPKLFTPNIIGLLGSLSDAAFLFVPFAKFGSDAVMVRYYSYFFDNPADFNWFTSFLLRRTLIGITAVTIIFLFFLQEIKNVFVLNSPLFSEFAYWVVPLGISLVFYSVIEAYCQVIKLTTPLVLVREIGLRVMLIGLAIAFFFQLLTIDILVLLYVSLFALGIVGLVIYLRNQNYLAINLFKKTEKNDLLNDINKYSLFMSIGGICAIALTKIDSLLVSSYLGLEENGIYRICFFMTVFIDMPGRSLKQVVAPFVAEYVQKNKIDELNRLYKRVSNTQLLVGIGLFLLIVINIDSIFALMPNGHIYAAGKYVLYWVGIAKLFDLATGNNEEIISYSKYYTWVFSMGILLVMVALGTGIYFIPKYGIIGAAIATALLIVLFNVIKFSIVYAKFKIHPFSISTIKCISIGVGTYLALWLLDDYLTINNLIVSIFIKSLIAMSIYGSLSFTLQVSIDINNYVFQLIDKLKK